MAEVVTMVTKEVEDEEEGEEDGAEDVTMTTGMTGMRETGGRIGREMMRVIGEEEEGEEVENGEEEEEVEEEEEEEEEEETDRMMRVLMKVQFLMMQFFSWKSQYFLKKLTLFIAGCIMGSKTLHKLPLKFTCPASTSATLSNKDELHCEDSAQNITCRAEQVRVLLFLPNFLFLSNSLVMGQVVMLHAVM